MNAEFQLIIADDEVETWAIGSWIYERNLITGKGKWEHLSAFDDNQCEWRDASPFSEEMRCP